MKEFTEILADILKRASGLIQQGCLDCFEAFDRTGQLTLDNVKLTVRMTTERVCNFISTELCETACTAEQKTKKKYDVA